MSRTSAALVAACAVFALACAGGGDSQPAPSQDTASLDTLLTDVGAGADATALDASWQDDATQDDSLLADTTASDGASTPDAAPLKGQTAWGPISGACGEVAAQLHVKEPSFLTTTWTFKTATSFNAVDLSPGAKKRYEGENAGGSSICSEVMSMQLLHECEGATLYKTEKEVGYRQQGSITDYVTTIANERVGVSVTRAYKGPTIQTYTDADAQTLLSKKLKGVLESSANVKAEDKWIKQVLHIWTMQPQWVPILKKAWDGLDAATRADTVVLVTIETNSEYVTADTCDEEK